jgi:hypothetical protein
MHRPTPTATPVKRSEPAATPVLPAPAVAWHFPTLHQPADKVILTLDNPNNVAATVQVRIIVKTATTVKRFLIPAASGTEVDLGTPAVSASLSLLATAPIVPQRLVIHHNSVRSSRGQPGA